MGSYYNIYWVYIGIMEEKMETTVVFLQGLSTNQGARDLGELRFACLGFGAFEGIRHQWGQKVKTCPNACFFFACGQRTQHETKVSHAVTP